MYLLTNEGEKPALAWSKTCLGIAARFRGELHHYEYRVEIYRGFDSLSSRGLLQSCSVLMPQASGMARKIMPAFRLNENIQLVLPLNGGINHPDNIAQRRFMISAH